MPETPEELYERAKDALRMPPVEDWETWPFDGEMRPRRLAPPAAEDTPRQGAGGVDCRRCEASDDEYLWTSERWRLLGLGPMGLPIVAMLEPREHFAEPGDVPDELWGDGGEHLHWWFMARPARLPQLAGSFVAIWDDVLPPLPEDIWREDLARLKAGLG
jgi:hypothetical protein